MKHILASLALLAATCGPALTQEAVPLAPEQAQAAPQLRIGVRSYARPFSYKSTKVPENISISTGAGPIRAAGFDGYLVYVCDEVLKQMLIDQQDAPRFEAAQIVVKDVDALMAAKREAYPDTQFEFDRLGLLGPEIDILCDPASLSAAASVVALPSNSTGVAACEPRTCMRTKAPIAMMPRISGSVDLLMVI